LNQRQTASFFEGSQGGEVSAAILFAAGRYNAFNFLSNNGDADDQAKAVEFYLSEYRKAIEQNLEGGWDYGAAAGVG
jgi:hypothetical protein